jgi:hypothetical protein
MKGKKITQRTGDHAIQVVEAAFYGFIWTKDFFSSDTA